MGIWEAMGNIYNTVFIVAEIKCPVLNTLILQTDHGFIFLFFQYRLIGQSDMFAWTLRIGHKNTKYCNFSTFSMFWTCFSTQNFFSCIRVSRHYEKLWTVIIEIHVAFWILNTFFQSFSCKHCIALVSLLEPDDALSGRIENRWEHDWLKPSSFVVYLHHNANIWKRLYSQSLF